jgi:hypothetical protein
MVRRETGLQGGVLLSKPAIHHRRFIVTGAVTALGLATKLGLATPSAAGAQTQGHHNKVTVIASHLNNPRGLAPRLWWRPLCKNGGQVVRIS